MLFNGSVFEDYNIFTTRYVKSIEDYFNISTLSLISVGLILLLFTYGNRSIRNYFFSISRLVHFVVLGLVLSNLGKNRVYYSYFLCYLFMFIFLINLVGLLPFTFAQTAHLTSTIYLASIMWVSCLLKGFYLHGIRFFRLFCPSGVPSVVIPILVFIETISFFFRLVSLGLRLFANIFAGHVLLETVGVITYKMILLNTETASIFSVFLVILPFVFLIILSTFEMIVAFIQSYIFIVLSVLYLTEAHDLH